MTYWWVNQNQTYDHEVGGGYLWSPKRNKNGARNQFYENMTRVQPGDVVLSYADGLIKAVGIAQGVAASAAKPTAFGPAGANWGPEGWLVQVAFVELARPVRPKDHMQDLRPTLPTKYSPLRETGDGLQSVYLAELPEAMALALRTLLGGQLEQIIEGSASAASDEAVERAILARSDIGPTEKQQLVRARRGQGIYRARLEELERGCRLTGVTLRAHLRASHAKPWRDSTDAEKLDGANGLLLSPHVDHLFDQGYIGFTEDGRVLVSSKLSPVLIAGWSLPLQRNVGRFTPAQERYLAYHREHVFKK